MRVRRHAPVAKMAGVVLMAGSALALSGCLSSTSPPINGAAGSPTSQQARDRRSALEPDRSPGARRAGKDADINSRFARVEASLDRLDHRQATGLAQLQERYEGKARRLHGVLAELGLKLAGPAPAGSGGPFVPIKLPGGVGSPGNAMAIF